MFDANRSCYCCTSTPAVTRSPPEYACNNTNCNNGFLAQRFVAIPPASPWSRRHSAGVGASRPPPPPKVEDTLGMVSCQTHVHRAPQRHAQQVTRRSPVLFAACAAIPGRAVWSNDRIEWCDVIRRSDHTDVDETSAELSAQITILNTHMEWPECDVMCVAVKAYSCNMIFTYFADYEQGRPRATERWLSREYAFNVVDRGYVG